MKLEGIVKDVPIVAFTAYVQEKETCIAAGMVDFCKLTIPIS